MKKVAVCPFYVSFSSMELPLILLLLVQVGSQIDTGGWGEHDLCPEEEKV